MHNSQLAMLEKWTFAADKTAENEIANGDQNHAQDWYICGEKGVSPNASGVLLRSLSWIQRNPWTTAAVKEGLRSRWTVSLNVDKLWSTRSLLFMYGEEITQITRQIPLNSRRGDRRQLVLPACCLTGKCYRNFSTWDPLQPAPIPAVYPVLCRFLQSRRKPALWP